MAAGGAGRGATREQQLAAVMWSFGFRSSELAASPRHRDCKSSGLLLDPRTWSWMQEEAPLPGLRQRRSSGPRTVDDAEFQDNLAEVLRRLTEREAVANTCLHALAF